MPAATAGEWRADKRHGQGICKFADGRKFRGAPSACLLPGIPGAAGLRFCCSCRGRRKCDHCWFLDCLPLLACPVGEWEDDGWVQSAADPQQCRVAGPGVTKAVAGQRAELVIEVGAPACLPARLPLACLPPAACCLPPAPSLISRSKAKAVPAIRCCMLPLPCFRRATTAAGSG